LHEPRTVAKKLTGKVKVLKMMLRETATLLCIDADVRMRAIAIQVFVQL
jgi:hypothetical protein